MKSIETYFEFQVPKLTLSALLSTHVYSIALLILFLLVGSSCSSSRPIASNSHKATHSVVRRSHNLPSTVAHLQKKVRKHRNNIAQKKLQYDGCRRDRMSDWRACINFADRPHNHWPFNFMQ